MPRGGEMDPQSSVPRENFPWEVNDFVLAGCPSFGLGGETILGQKGRTVNLSVTDPRVGGKGGNPPKIQTKLSR